MAGPEKPKVTGCVEGMGDMALQPKKTLKGGQDQVGVPQVPLLGHGDAIETQN